MNCVRNPCDDASCAGVPGARCVPDYCGGCNTRWFDGDLEVTDMCAGTINSHEVVIKDAVVLFIVS